MRREPGFGAQALLEPFAHGIANRAAGASVDLFAVIGEGAIHAGFRWFTITTPYQVPDSQIVSRRRGLPGILVKIV